MISTKEEAQKLVSFIRMNDEPATIVVSESGSMFFNCDVDATCSTLDSEKEKYFILKGEKKNKKSVKETE